MGVKMDQKLTQYAVVLKVDSSRGAEKYINNCSTPEGVLNLLSKLKDNEKIHKIIHMDDEGNTQLHTIAFRDGRLAVVNNEPEEEVSI